MTAKPALDPATAAALRARAEALEAAAQGLGRTAHGLTFGISRKCVRAYVFATHRGRDPLPAVAAAKFGDAKLGDGGWATVKAYVERLAALDPTNPARGGTVPRQSERG